MDRTAESWFRQVLYVGNMGIDHFVRKTNNFLDVQRSLEGTRKLYNDFRRIYESTFPKIEAILKLPSKT